jgi:outer membrane protein TolC
MDDQVEEAAMAQAVFSARYQNALRRLAFLTGLDEKAISCPAPGSLNEKNLDVIQPGSESPLIIRAVADEKSARAEVSRSSAGNYPRLNALASVGDVSQTLVVEKMNYSGGFGFDFPIFEGFRVASDIHRAQALTNEKNNDLLAVRLELDELNAHYDDIIQSSRIRLDYLDRQLQAAHKALDSSWHRYLTFLGPLVEVREASRNLARIETQTSEVKADLLLAIGSKSLLNGGSVR